MRNHWPSFSPPFFLFFSFLSFDFLLPPAVVFFSYSCSLSFCVVVTAFINYVGSFSESCFHCFIQLFSDSATRTTHSLCLCLSLYCLYLSLSVFPCLFLSLSGREPVRKARKFRHSPREDKPPIIATEWTLSGVVELLSGGHDTGSKEVRKKKLVALIKSSSEKVASGLPKRAQVNFAALGTLSSFPLLFCLFLFFLFPFSLFSHPMGASLLWNHLLENRCRLFRVR